MKKILAIILVLCMVLPMVFACGSSGEIAGEAVLLESDESLYESIYGDMESLLDSAHNSTGSGAKDESESESESGIETDSETDTESETESETETQTETETETETGVNVDFDKAAFLREGSKIYFGSYPQTEVTNDTLKATLNGKAGALPTSENAQNWSVYEDYYINNVETKFMWYIDVEENGANYRGVYFTEYRPVSTDAQVASYQQDNKYALSTVYWFKYEPISWTILKENTTDNTALILCDMIIDSQQFDYDGVESSNNYAQSTIRAWLNETFYNTVFNEMQKQLILTTEVDNSVESAGNSIIGSGCENTLDKLFLLSYQDMINTAYGYSSDPSAHDTLRQKKATDYAKVQGAYVCPMDSMLNNGHWWTRSSYEYDSKIVRVVHYEGYTIGRDYVYHTYYGVVPALQIKL